MGNTITIEARQTQNIDNDYNLLTDFLNKNIELRVYDDYDTDFIFFDSLETFKTNIERYKKDVVKLLPETKPEDVHNFALLASIVNSPNERGAALNELVDSMASCGRSIKVGDNAYEYKELQPIFDTFEKQFGDDDDDD